MQLSVHFFLQQSKTNLIPEFSFTPKAIHFFHNFRYIFSRLLHVLTVFFLNIFVGTRVEYIVHVVRMKKTILYQNKEEKNNTTTKQNERKKKKQKLIWKRRRLGPLRLTSVLLIGQFSFVLFVISWTWRLFVFISYYMS